MDPTWWLLEARKSLLLDRALAPNTLNTYQVGIRQYVAFCLSFEVSPLPLREPVLEYFWVSLSSRISHKSIKVYLCGVQFWSKINGGSVLIENMHRLDYVIMANRRAQGTFFDRPARPPVTLQMLQEICAFISNTESPFDRDMQEALQSQHSGGTVP